MDKNGKERKSYAKKVINFFQKINDCVLTLSPSQKKWVNDEFKEYDRTKNLRRLWQFQESKEYLMFTLKENINSMIEKLKLIIDTKQKKREVYLWSLLVESLLKYEYWQDLVSLINLGIVDKKIFYSNIKDEINNYHFFANNGQIPAELILRNIIQPYLLGTLPD